MSRDRGGPRFLFDGAARVEPDQGAAPRLSRRTFLARTGAAIGWLGGLRPARAISGPSDRVDLRSPSGAVGLGFRLAARDGKTGVPVYGVSFEGRELVKESGLGLDLDSGPLDSGLRVVRVSRRSVDETIRGDFGKASSARDRYEESVVSLAESGGRGRRLDVALRAYDDGIAFRYVVPGQEGLADFVIREEKTELSFGGEPTLYGLPLPFGSAYEGQYQVGPLARAEGVQYGLPLLLQYPDGTHVGVTEANLTDYAGLYLAGVPGQQGLLRSRLAPSTEEPRVKVRATAPHPSPWRVIMIARGPGALIESNLVTSLNEPPLIADTSWIRPGKVQFPWWNAYHMPEMRGRGGLNTETLKRYIDFAAENGIGHHSIDGIHWCGGARGEAWYGGPIDTYEGADITKAIPEIDLPEVLAYARSKGVRTRLWLHWRAVDEHMDRAFPLYEQWGIEGVMVDFMNGDSQEMVRFVHRVLKKAAAHRLTVSLHGSYKPTGIRRTYPNLMTTEAVFNLEQNKWSPTGSTPEHELLVPFIRMLAGPLDYHQGSFKPVSPARYKPRYTAPNAIGTLTRQLAMYVVYENPMPMVADYPAAYQGHPAFKFVREVPTVWDETRVLEGQVGRYIAIARRRGRDWYVGCMTDREARAVTLPLGFLGEGGWTAEVYRDHPESGRDPERFEIRRMRVSASHSIEAWLAPAGGLAIRLTPARQGGT